MQLDILFGLGDHDSCKHTESKKTEHSQLMYIYIYTYMYTHMYIHTAMYTYIHLYIPIYIYMYNEYTCLVLYVGQLECPCIGTWQLGKTDVWQCYDNTPPTS